MWLVTHKFWLNLPSASQSIKKQVQNFIEDAVEGESGGRKSLDKNNWYWEVNFNKSKSDEGIVLY